MIKENFKYSEKVFFFFKLWS